MFPTFSQPPVSSAFIANAAVRGIGFSPLS